MGEADRFYSAPFYSVTRTGSRVSHRVERLAAVVVALCAAMLLGGPSSDDATDFGVAQRPPSVAAAPSAVAATAVASAPCAERDGAACTEMHDPAPSFTPKPPVRWNPFSGR